MVVPSFFYLLPEKAVLIDNNPELINFYLVVRDNLDVLLLILQNHKNESEYYYRIRALNPEALDPVSRASRFLYLNKTGYNGLWRVNRQGKHNVPFGRYKNPKIADAENLRWVSDALKRAQILLDDFSAVLNYAERGDFIYFDPPYYPLSETAYFTDYTVDSFGRADQERLAATFQELDKGGCLVMLSNSDTPFIRELYTGYEIQNVYAKRAINCRAERRGFVAELVVRNYD